MAEDFSKHIKEYHKRDSLQRKSTEKATEETLDEEMEYARDSLNKIAELIASGKTIVSPEVTKLVQGLRSELEKAPISQKLQDEAVKKLYATIIRNFVKAQRDGQTQVTSSVERLANNASLCANLLEHRAMAKSNVRVKLQSDKEILKDNARIDKSKRVCDESKVGTENLSILNKNSNWPLLSETEQAEMSESDARAFRATCLARQENYINALQKIASANDLLSKNADGSATFFKGGYSKFTPYELLYLMSTLSKGNFSVSVDGSSKAKILELSGAKDVNDHVVFLTKGQEKIMEKVRKALISGKLENTTDVTLNYCLRKDVNSTAATLAKKELRDLILALAEQQKGQEKQNLAYADFEMDHKLTSYMIDHIAEVKKAMEMRAYSKAETELENIESKNTEKLIANQKVEAAHGAVAKQVTEKLKDIRSTIIVNLETLEKVCEEYGIIDPSNLYDLKPTIVKVADECKQATEKDTLVPFAEQISSLDKTARAIAYKIQTVDSKLENLANEIESTEDSAETLDILSLLEGLNIKSFDTSTLYDFIISKKVTLSIFFTDFNKDQNHVDASDEAE